MWCSIYRSTQKIVDFIGIILERGVGGGAELLLEPAAQQLCANPADEKVSNFVTLTEITLDQQRLTPCGSRMSQPGLYQMLKT